MKNILLVFLLGLTISCSKKQNNYDDSNDEESNYKGFATVKHNPSITILQGIWNINELIISDETKEYSLFPKDPDGYIGTENNFSGSENNRNHKIGHYVLDWENDSEAIKNISGNARYFSIHQIKVEIKSIMDEIKKQNL